jgi:hypothetical protein
MHSVQVNEPQEMKKKWKEEWLPYVLASCWHRINFTFIREIKKKKWKGGGGDSPSSRRVTEGRKIYVIVSEDTAGQKHGQVTRESWQSK